MTRISVVIPFYQEKSGILSKAIASILAQTKYENIEEILIIDDGSPISSDSEMPSVGSREKIKIIKKQNGGVSSARNYGLDNVSNNSKYVAFLDADDIWLECHIENALIAIKEGADFYFSNFTQLNQSQGAFERSGRIDLEQHTKIHDETIYKFETNMVEQIINGNVIGTPTVVYDYSKYREVRFNQKFKYAGEDYLMWISLTKSNNNIYFCQKVTCQCGEGINIFSGAKWGTRHLALRLLDEINYRKVILSTLELPCIERKSLKKAIRKKKVSFVKNALSMLKNFDFSLFFIPFSK